VGGAGQRIAARDHGRPRRRRAPGGAEHLALRMPRQVDQHHARHFARPDEIGQQPHGVARADEADVRHEVSRLEAHVGLESGVPAELLGPLA
jgi:hypothetical protein